MMPARGWDSWLEQVTAQLRCRAAVKTVKAELEAHLQDQYEAFLAEGDNAEQAMSKTLESMGDPVEVGMRLDGVHRPQSAWAPFLLVSALFIMGALLRCWGLAELDRAEDITWMLLRSIVPIAVLALVYFMTDAAASLRYTWLWYGGSLALVAAVVFVSQPINGTYIYARSLCAFLAFGHAAVLYRQRKKGLVGLLAGMLSLIPMLLAALWVPATNQMLCLALAGFVLCMYCAWKDWFGWGARKSVGLTITAAVGVPFVLVMTNLNLVQRMFERLNPFVDPTGAGFLSLLRLTIWQGNSPLQPSTWLQAVDEESVYRLLSSDYPLTFGAYAFGRPAALAMLALMILCLVLLWRAVLRTHSAAGRFLGLAGAAVLTGELLFSAGAFSGVVLFLSDGIWNGCVQAAMAGMLLSAFRLDSVKGGWNSACERKGLRLQIRWE